jgi:chromosome segregation ATPase
MGTNGTDIDIEARLEDEMLRSQRYDHSEPPGPVERAGLRRRAAENRLPAREQLRSTSAAEPAEAAEGFVLAPLVDKIAYGIARGLVVAMKELEDHIAGETRKVGDTFERRLDVIQGILQEQSKFVGEQRSTNAAVQDRLQELTDGLHEAGTRHAEDVAAIRGEAREISAAISQRIDSSTASLQESDARQAADLAALQSETRALSESVTERIDALCRELGVHQEDIAAVKIAVSAFSSRVDGLVERLERQGDALRSMFTAYSQRETELGQLVDGLARLRAFPTQLPSSGL